MPGRIAALALVLLALALIPARSARAGDGIPATGIAEIDAVIRAVTARDAQTLIGLVRYSELPCSPEGTGLGAPPPCDRLGVPAGTVVPLLPVSISETEYMPEASAPGFLRGWLERSGLAYYGVLRPADLASAAFLAPVAEYAVVFRATAPPGLALALHLIAGRIVVVQGFGVAAHALPAPNDPAWILPPPP